MPPSLADFRSDTVTRPTPPMRAAMAAAEVGDDVYGEDPTVRQLEEATAQRLGHEAGLFVSSGTQANQIAVGVFCRPGDEVLLDANSHGVHYEGGATAALWGAQIYPLASPRGILSEVQVRAAMRPDDDHAPHSRLLLLENTHNRGGGAVWPLEAFARVVAVAREHRLAVHLDGARLWNAEAATGSPVRSWAELSDSATVAFSKGLGAPVGSVLVGSRSFIHEARRLRKRLGGGMRQAGIIAAGALYALEHHVERLAEDHRHARQLAEGLAVLPGLRVDLARVETNMVYADFPCAAPEAVARLRAAGVLGHAVGPRTLRFVCHLDVGAEEVRRALEAARRLAEDVAREDGQA
ncbi:MAG: threonine aldolase family protein [Myxococcaceae bacterium]